MARAPRLTPSQRIAPHVTRVGRFRGIDPSKGRRPPTFWAQLGRVGWAVLVAESLRRAWRRGRGPAASQDVEGEAAASRPD